MVYDLGFMVNGLWFMVDGLWFTVQGLRFMVYGLWLGSLTRFTCIHVCVCVCVCVCVFWSTLLISLWFILIGFDSTMICNCCAWRISKIISQTK